MSRFVETIKDTTWEDHSHATEKTWRAFEEKKDVRDIAL